MLSATLPGPIRRLAQRYMYNPKVINFSKDSLAGKTIEQYVLRLPESMKFHMLSKLLQREKPEQAIVFCRTKLGTARLYRKLDKTGDYGNGIGSLHGDMNQSARDRVMKRFRAGDLQLLVATDVVGRGIDVSNISHIINYDIPEVCEDYVHRVGRTGRMGKEGVAYSLVTPYQKVELARIEEKISLELTEDALQEEIEETWEDFEPRAATAKKAKKRYRNAL